jgi:response regulator of citrate/malate metabolism
LTLREGLDRRVLIVEDDRAVARLHCRYVSRRPGHTVVGIAETGVQAYTMVTSPHPDVVLLDLGLPGATGLEVLRKMRHADSPVEVIVVSAHASPSTVRACFHLGVVDYLVKPFWPQRLGEALDLLDERMDTLRHSRRLDQEAIDRLRGHASEATASARSAARTGPRLSAVRCALEVSGLALTADDVADATGMARVTARRYLEQLVARGVCTVETDPDGPGRPRKFYRLWASKPVGGASAGGGA